MAESDETPPQVGAEPTQDWALAIETCRVAVRRGQLTSVFYARAAEHDAVTPITEPSAPFSWPPGSEPATEEARLAHYELLARLRAEGWTATGRAGDWYATELVRPTLLPTERARELAEPPESGPTRSPAQDASPPPFPASRVASTAPRRTWLARRQTAGVGLVGALALLGWVATHAWAV